MEISRFIVYNTNLTSKSKSGFTCNFLWHRSYPMPVTFRYRNLFATKTYLYIIKRSVIITRTIGYGNIAGTYMQQRKPRCITYSACNAMAYTLSIVFLFDSCNSMHACSAEFYIYTAVAISFNAGSVRIYIPSYFRIIIIGVYYKCSSSTIGFQVFYMYRIYINGVFAYYAIAVACRTFQFIFGLFA